ncbi:MAG: DUF3368 domain-containing protein [Acidobacteriota bacterium]|jgi:predicted nucleic acid-binding protein|nr:DUF3368 domain-containing protein [Acidobacteriota bacterium]
MLIEKVVINASPFIILCKSGLIELLPELFTEIYMPETVSIEIIEGKDIVTEKLYDCEETWLKRCLTSTVEDVLVWNLGGGETEVLSFASANGYEYTALIDDRAARKCAEALGIKTLGTAGILVLAKKRNLIKDVSVELKKLRSAGLWLSDEIFNAALKQANEL